MQVQTVSFECPFCCVTLKMNAHLSLSEENATHYSDGYIEYEDSIRLSRIVQCPACNEVFFYDSLETQPLCNPDEICVDILEPPVDRYFELLKNTGLTSEQELYLRKEIWYYGTHHTVGSNEILNNPDFKNLWLDNLEILEQNLTETDNEQLLLKAEANRHLGRFIRCLELLDKHTGEKDNKYLKTIRKKIRKGSTDVFEV
jgi:hypothetical protein